MLSITFIKFSANEPDELCASMYSFHSSPEEKNRLLFALTQHGIETTVDRVEKKKRIRDWIQESVIQEEEDEEETETQGESEEPFRRSRAPVPGHVSSVRAEEKAARTQIVTTVKDSANKHINPRTGKVQQGSSEMGHHETESQANAHHHHHHHSEKNGKSASHTNQSNQNSSHNNQANQKHDHTSSQRPEMRKENGYEYQARRATKLVDVGSQTSSESQKQIDAANNARQYTPERPRSIGDAYVTANAHSVPSISHAPTTHSSSTTQNMHSKISRMDNNQPNTTSRGFMSAFNSLATVSVPESQQPTNSQHQQQSTNTNQASNHQYHDRERFLHRRESYQQRHKTTGLINKQPMSRSMHNFSSLVNDSGYGSLDKVNRPIDPNAIISSPVLSKRSLGQAKAGNSKKNGTQTSNERIHINGVSHSQNESCSPFHSDSGGEASPRGSNGFVNYVGTNQSDTYKTAIPMMNEGSSHPLSMKDTAYDRFRNRK